MAAEPRDPNLLLPLGELRSTRPGDLPPALLRRYFTEDHGRAWRLFTDAQARTPVIEDRGRRLLSRRSDPNAVRDMVRIAEHRGWRTIEARGAEAFRREVWLAARTAGLDVRGYRPTERDRQDLARRTARERPAPEAAAPIRRPPLGSAPDRLQAVETVVRARVRRPEDQERLLARARARIADWLERGARFPPSTPVRGLAPDAPRRERRRTH